MSLILISSAISLVCVVQLMSTRGLHFRETQDPSLLEYAARQIQDAFGQQRYFNPDSLFIVTWDDVGYYSQKYDKVG